MAVAVAEAILEFLRNNGFSEAAAALTEDICQRRQIHSLNSEKYLFPVVKIPLPLKIPPNCRPSQVVFRVDDSESVLTSSDEFLSVYSSGLDASSSDFTNPHGNEAAPPDDSGSSSDMLSVFYTARNYHEFDMQNQLSFDGNGDDYLACPSEDKFILPPEVEKEHDCELDRCCSSPSALNMSHYLEKACVNEIIDITRDHYSEFIRCKDTGALETLETWPWIDFESVKGNLESKSELCNDPITAEEMSERFVELDRNTNGKQDNTAEFPMPRDTADELEVFNLRIIHRKNRTGFEESKDFPIDFNTVISGMYYLREYIGSATFSKVVRAQNMETGIDVCLKIIKNDKDCFDQSLDEIKLLKLANKYDPADERHILRLYDYYYHHEHLFIVTELLQANLHEFQRVNQDSVGEPYFTLVRLKSIARQCLEALEYLHFLGIIHCDLKPENIVMRSYESCEIKIIDLGSSCFKTDNLCPYVQSRSYRAPEIILGLSYDEKIDIWSLGCILAELYSGSVLFPNEVLAALLGRIAGLLGPFDSDMLLNGRDTDKYFTEDYDLFYINEETNEVEYTIPMESSLEHELQASDAGFLDFLTGLLQVNPLRRPTASQALQHPWLHCI